MVVGNAEDIYELLDISPDASGTLAREMYWEKMRPLTQGGGRNAYAIESLNRALAIILDDKLRAEYDASRPNKREREAEEAQQFKEKAVASKESGGGTREVANALIAGAALLMTFVVWRSFGAAAGIAMVPISLLTVLVVRAVLDRPQAHPAYTVLHLRRGASREHIEIAYRVRAQQILLQVRYNPKAISELDELDRAYVSAMTLAYRADTEMPRRMVPGINPASPIGRWVARLAAAGLELVYSVLVRAGSSALRGANEMRSAAEREIAARTNALSQPPPAPMFTPNMAGGPRDGASPATPPSAPVATLPLGEIDLQQRLRAGLKSNAAQIARAAPPLASETEPATAPAAVAYLLLESAMGTRRLPMGDKPVSIGSSPSCDVVLPEREDVALEHALVWQHGSRVILHAGLSAICYVNGSPVTWGLLDDGDELKIGGYTLRVSVPAPATVVAAAVEAPASAGGGD